MAEEIQTTVPEDGMDEIDTDAEFRALLTDSNEGAERLKGLAAAMRKSGHTDIADVYDEVRGTVMSLLSDFIASTAGAIVSLEDSVAEQAEEEVSRLLPEDADKYLMLFVQFAKLLDELAGVIPAGSDGDAQREVFATMRRMTDGMAAFTQEITIGAGDDDDPDEEPNDDDDAAPDSE